MQGLQKLKEDGYIDGVLIYTASPNNIYVREKGVCVRDENGKPKVISTNWIFNVLKALVGVCDVKHDTICDIFDRRHCKYNGSLYTKDLRKCTEYGNTRDLFMVDDRVDEVVLPSAATTLKIPPYTAEVDVMSLVDEVPMSQYYKNYFKRKYKQERMKMKDLDDCSSDTALLRALDEIRAFYGAPRAVVSPTTVIPSPCHGKRAKHVGHKRKATELAT